MTLTDFLDWLLGLLVGLCAVFFGAAQDIRLAHTHPVSPCRREAVQ